MIVFVELFQFIKGLKKVYTIKLNKDKNGRPHGIE